MRGLTGKGAAGAVLTLLLVASSVQVAAAPLVRSRDGRLQAIAVPETNWCGPAVNIRVESPSGKLPEDEEFLVRFLTGTKAAVQAECPGAQFMRVDSVSGGFVADYSYAFREADWNFVHVPGVTGRRRSGIVATLSPVNLRAVAKTEALLLSAPAKRDAAFLNDGPNMVGPVQWEIDRVALSLSVDAVDSNNPQAIADLLSGMERGMRGLCPAKGAVVTIPPNSNAAQFTLACREGDTRFLAGVLAYPLGNLTAVVRFASLRGEPEEDRRLGALMTAFDERFRQAP